MKQYLSICLFATGLASAPSAWSAPLELSGGIGQWHVSFDGDVGTAGATTPLNELGIRNQNSQQLWLSLTHPLPILPNIRLMHSSVNTRQESITRRQFVLAGITIDAEIEVHTEMDLSHSDATFFYRLVDTAFKLDAGITARYFSGLTEVQSEVTLPARINMNGTVPLLYLSSQLDMPLSGWHLGVAGNVVDYRGDRISDLSAHIGYGFEMTPLLEIGARIGYRRLAIKAEDFYGLYSDAVISGGFMEFFVSF